MASAASDLSQTHQGREALQQSTGGMAPATNLPNANGVTQTSLAPNPTAAGGKAAAAGPGGSAVSSASVGSVPAGTEAAVAAAGQAVSAVAGVGQGQEVQEVGGPGGMNGAMMHGAGQAATGVVFQANNYMPQYYYDYSLGGYTEAPPLRPEQWEEMMRMAGGMGGPGGEGPDGQQPMAAFLPYVPGSPALPLNASLYGTNMGYPYAPAGVAPIYPPHMMTSAAPAAPGVAPSSANPQSSTASSNGSASAAASGRSPSSSASNHQGGSIPGMAQQQQHMQQMQIPLHSFGGRPHPSQPSAGMSPVAAAAAAFSQLSMAQQQQQQQQSQGGGRGRGGQEQGGRGRGGRSGAWGPGRGRGRGRAGPVVYPLTNGHQAVREEGEELVGVRSFGGDEFNKPDFPVKYKMAKFFVIKSYSEDDVHKSIKYKVWTSTPNGNKRLDAAFSAAKALSEANSGTPCPIFLFFSVNGSGQFCGVAEMGSSVDFERSLDYWQQDKWMGQFSCKWHLVKDVPNSQFRHIIVAANEGKPVTNSRDTQEVGLEQGLEMLSIFKAYGARTSILDDFPFYDDRERLMQERRNRQSHVVQQRRNVPFQYMPAQILPAQIVAPQAAAANGVQSVTAGSLVPQRTQ